MILLLLAACAGHAAPPAPEPPVPHPMTPEPERTFEEGPPIADAAALLGWLEGTGKRRVRLPVVVAFEPLGVRRAWVGNGGAEPPEGALLLKLDDTAMGVALLDHLRRACGEAAATCAVWLEGTWGPVIAGMPAMPGFDTGPKLHDFAVRRFVGRADASATHAQVEAG